MTHCKCPYGDVGDLLWVRETYGNDIETGKTVYEAGTKYSNRDKEWNKEWNNECLFMEKRLPSIFMPKKVCRLWLITNIKVERLQDILHEDIRKEGVQLQPGDNLWQKHFGDSPAVAFSKSEAFFDELAMSIKNADYRAWENIWIKVNGKSHGTKIRLSG